MNKGKYKSEIISNIKKLLFSNVTTTIIGLISFPLVFKYLSVEEYGIFTLVFSMVGVLTIFNQMISGNTILPLVVSCIEKKDTDKEYSILKFYINFGKYIFFVSIIIIGLSLFFIYNIDIKIIAIFIGYLGFYQLNTFLLNISLMYKDYSYITIVTVLRNLLRLLIILFFIYTNMFNNALEYLTTYLCTEIILLIISSRKIYFLKQRFKNTAKIKISAYISIREIFKNNTFNFFGNNIAEGKQILIVWIINTFFNTEIVGVFGAIKKIINLLGSIYKNFEAAIFPYISSIIERRENSNLVKNINGFSFIFTTMLLIILVLLNKYVIIYLISNEYLKYSSIFIVGYFSIISSSFQLSQKSLLYSMQLTNIIFRGAIVEIMLFAILLSGCMMYSFSLAFIIVADIISKIGSTLYKKGKLDKIIKNQGLTPSS